MLQAITPKTSLVVITNPNNPTGTLLSYEAIEEFVDALPEHVVVIIDEAYYHFIKDPNYRSAITLATSRDNVIVVRTFAKVYGIRGVMVGYAITSQAIKQKLMLYNSGRTSPLALMAALAALGDHEHVRRSRETVIASRERLFEAFEEMGLEYIPSETNFVQFNVNRDTKVVRQALLDRRIAISPRGSHKMKGWLRVSVGTMEETDTFIKAFRDVLPTVPLP
jgi:histidinol-phosphate aminotransferase